MSSWKETHPSYLRRGLLRHPTTLVPWEDHILRDPIRFKTQKSTVRVAFHCIGDNPVEQDPFRDELCPMEIGAGKDKDPMGSSRRSRSSTLLRKRVRTIPSGIRSKDATSYRSNSVERLRDVVRGFPADAFPIESVSNLDAFPIEFVSNPERIGQNRSDRKGRERWKENGTSSVGSLADASEVRHVRRDRARCNSSEMSAIRRAVRTQIRRKGSRSASEGFHPVDRTRRVLLYDTTLRDGAQMVDIALTLEDKLKIARRLCDFGVGYVEAGWPGSNPKDAAFFDAWNGLHLDQHLSPHGTRLAAFGSTRRKNTPCEQDPNIRSLLESKAPVLTMVAKAWSEQVVHVLNTTKEENLNMIRDSVSYCKSQGREVMLDAEHFFDGFKNDEGYAIECLHAAAESGADVVVLCDTNGGCLPWEVEAITATAFEVVSQYGDVMIGIHTHNDTGMAVANSLAAVRAGATLVQGCINGIGERTGNADLITVAANLALKMGLDCLPEGKLAELTDLAHAVADTCHQPRPKSNPYVGTSAFAHKGGIHVAAVRRLPRSYNHIVPGLVGNAMRSVVSELSGRGNILDKVESAGLQLDKEGVGSVLAMIKRLENEGFAFENAGASVDMILIRRGKSYTPPFRVLEYTVMSGNRLNDNTSSTQHSVPCESTNQAMVKLEVDGNVFMSAGEGNGPVDALAAALRTGLSSKFPQIDIVLLQDYNVHLLDTKGSQSTTRVTIEFSNPEGVKWSTVGAHTSIVEASFRALLDGLEFGILNCSMEGCSLGGTSINGKADSESIVGISS